MNPGVWSAMHVCAFAEPYRIAGSLCLHGETGNTMTRLKRVSFKPHGHTPSEKGFRRQKNVDLETFFEPDGHTTGCMGFRRH